MANYNQEYENELDLSGIDPYIAEQLEKLYAAGQLPADFDPEMVRGLTEADWAGMDPGATAVKSWDVQDSPYRYSRIGLSGQATAGAGGRARRTATAVQPFRGLMGQRGYDTWGKMDLPVTTYGSVPSGFVYQGQGTPEDIVDYWNEISGQLTPEQIEAMGPMVDVMKYDVDVIADALGVSPEELQQIKDSEIEQYVFDERTGQSGDAGRMGTRDNRESLVAGLQPISSPSQFGDLGIGQTYDEALQQAYNTYLESQGPVNPAMAQFGSGGPMSMEEFEQTQFDPNNMQAYNQTPAGLSPEGMFLASLENAYAGGQFDPSLTGNWDMVNMMSGGVAGYAPQAGAEGLWQEPGAMETARGLTPQDPSQLREFDPVEQRRQEQLEGLQSYTLEDGTEIYFDPESGEWSFGGQYNQIMQDLKDELKRSHAASWGEKYFAPGLLAGVGGLFGALGPIGAGAWSAMQSLATGQFDPLGMAMSMGVSMIPMFSDIGFGDIMSGNWSGLAKGLQGGFGNLFNMATPSLGKLGLSAGLGAGAGVTQGLATGQAPTPGQQIAKRTRRMQEEEEV